MKNLTYKISLLILGLLATAFVVNAQEIKGVVSDANGQPLIGVSVFVDGTTLGVSTGVDGDYTIEVPSAKGKTLVFLKPCDTYSFNQLIKEHRVDREKAYIVGVGCKGKLVIEKAKKAQVPSHVIDNAIKKAQGGSGEALSPVVYEGYGPGNSAIIVEALTDNVNRSVSDVRTVVNKCHVKMGAMGSVAYMYDNLCVISFKGLTEDETLEEEIGESSETLQSEENPTPEVNN